MEPITSRQNPRIKQLLRLQKSHVRRQEKIFLIEGIKEITKALHSGYRFEEVYFEPELADQNLLKKIILQWPQIIQIPVSRGVFEKIAYRETSGGMVVIAGEGKHTLENLKSNGSPLYLVIEGIEKPGNLGAIYRTADAAGVDGIIISDPRADIYNPNAIRASLGCVFTVPTAICSGDEAISWLRERHIVILSTYLEASVPYHTVDYTKASAIVMGTEATGISDQWVRASDANIIIPMRGQADSMNVSVSTAVVLFEAMRQREFH